jgi:hypothetical protein
MKLIASMIFGSSSINSTFLPMQPASPPMQALAARLRHYSPFPAALSKAL